MTEQPGLKIRREKEKGEMFWAGLLRRRKEEKNNW